MIEPYYICCYKKQYAMYKKREIVGKINTIKKQKQGRILVFTGARQVGKTTVVKQFMNEYEYLSMEDPVSLPSYRQLTAKEWHRFYPKAALDEVQKAPVLIESIKATYDLFDDVRYVLLGSSQLLLLEKVKESLAGRCVIFDMYPLTLPELASDENTEIVASEWQNLLNTETEEPQLLPSSVLDARLAIKKQSWQHYTKFGGYPALVSKEMTDEQRFVWLQNYVRTYLERDVRDLASFRSLEPFIKLQHAIALQTGELFNASSLAVKIQMTSKTVQRYLQYLTLSYQVVVLQAWTRNKSKRLSKSPKIHYLDNGVLQAVLKKRGGITGNEFESLVIAEMYKQAQNSNSLATFYHLRTHDGKEVDLLVELPNGYYAFEIKMAEYVSKTDAKHFRDLEELLDKPLLHSFILSNSVKTEKITDKITAVNVVMFLG